MTTARTSTARRLARPTFALLAGAGIALTPQVAQASTEPPPAASSSEGSPAAPDQAAQTAVDTAMNQRGKPYEYGAAGPDSYDCSGLTQYAWGAAGVELPHSSKQQSQTGTPVARADLQPGDLVFFYDPVSHAGVYVGNNQVVHAPTEGDVVKVTDIDAIGDYNSARRVG
ncbi:C40 family peptidase [Geodermatophilus ruber]|uniref:Cell wall-associated hydrolase, NlpC family n=1 Tax=Geodermatophilus ruber TaxID=504800 RepID=A0A1I4AF53_9ACTN|nr:Cell wall-associated hydrolase, NlpC family [Geodermatophilus ruber]